MKKCMKKSNNKNLRWFRELKKFAKRVSGRESSSLSYQTWNGGQFEIGFSLSLSLEIYQFVLWKGFVDDKPVRLAVYFTLSSAHSKKSVQFKWKSIPKYTPSPSMHRHGMSCSKIVFFFLLFDVCFLETRTDEHEQKERLRSRNMLELMFDWEGGKGRERRGSIGFNVSNKGDKINMWCYFLMLFSCWEVASYNMFESLSLSLPFSR